MKTSLLLLFSLLFMSCNSGGLSAPQQSNTDWKNVSLNIGQSYLQDENFMQCTQSSIDQCMLSVRDTEKELSLDDCDDFLLEANRQSCKQNIIISSAMKDGNTESCDTLDDSQWCKYEVLVTRGISIESPSVCSELDEDLQIQCNNSIIRSISLSKWDVELCDKILVSEDEWNRESEVSLCKQEIVLESELQEQMIQTELEAQAQEDREETLIEEIISIEEIIEEATPPEEWELTENSEEEVIPEETQ